MKLTFLSGVLLFNLNFCFSQIKYDKIEFEHSNPIIMSSYTKIKFLPIKNNKKGKVNIIFEDKDSYYSKRISNENYLQICSAIEKIKKDFILDPLCIDGSDTSIMVYYHNEVKNKYYMNCISSKDGSHVDRKDFWLATKLIVEIAGIKLNNLGDYN